MLTKVSRASPGFYFTRIAYYAYKGFKGFSFSNITPVSRSVLSSGYEAVSLVKSPSSAL
jgi:hypothetical protein